MAMPLTLTGLSELGLGICTTAEMWLYLIYIWYLKGLSAGEPFRETPGLGRIYFHSLLSRVKWLSTDGCDA